MGILNHECIVLPFYKRVKAIPVVADVTTCYYFVS